MTDSVPLLEARDLAKSYGPVLALRSADLVVEPGEVHALLGANGAGKSTLVKILTGVIAADRGTVAVNGKAVRIGSPAQAARIGLAPVFQDPALVPDLTVAQNLRLTGADADAVRRELRRDGPRRRLLRARARRAAAAAADDRPRARARRATRSCCCSTRSPPRCRPTSPSACSR